MDEWMVRLRDGNSNAAWDLFVTRYRRLLIAAIQHYVREHDDVMDGFAWVCEGLRKDDLHRLRSYLDAFEHRARFSTWLVTVVRHLTVDWIRHRDGRRALPELDPAWPPLRQAIVRRIFIERHSHRDAFELIRSGNPPGPSYHEFVVELRAAYGDAQAGRLKGFPARDLPLPPPEPAPSDDPTELVPMMKALATLPPEDRAAVQLYVVEELPAADIARLLGLPNAKAVYNKVYRALASVRSWLSNAGIGREDL